MGWPPTLKLSVLEAAWTKPWEQPLPQGLSTFEGSPTKVCRRRDPDLVNTAVVRRIEEGYIDGSTEFDVHSTAASSVWKNLVVNRRNKQATRNGHFPVRDGIGAEKIFPARIGDLEIVVAVGQSRGSGRCVRTRAAIKVHARRATFRAVQILIHPRTRDVRGKDGSWKWRCCPHRSHRNNPQHRSRNCQNRNQGQ